MSIAALIRDMAAAGAPPEAIAIAVDAIEQAQANIDARKAVERDRKRRQREKARDITGTVTGQSQDMDGTVPDKPSPFDKETLSPKPPIKEIKSPTREGGDALPRKAGGFSAPDGVDPKTWAAFCQQRKKSITQIAFDRISRTLCEGTEAGWPPGELIERAVERGYETIFVPSEKRNGQRPANDRSNEPTNPMVRAGIALEARFAGIDGPG